MRRLRDLTRDPRDTIAQQGSGAHRPGITVGPGPTREALPSGPQRACVGSPDLDADEAVPKIDIVVTTVFEPEWLAGYLGDIRAHGWDDQVTLRIICDRKTPGSVFEAAHRAVRDGFMVDCPSLDEQTKYLRRVGVSDDLIPWDTDNRRNIGFLRAIAHDADVMISIDDDNFCREGSDFIGRHLFAAERAGADADAKLASGPWFNVCSLLTGTHAGTIHPRGFPYAERGRTDGPDLIALPADVAEMPIAINAGLWLDEPDVDAITRLSIAPRITTASDQAVVLGPDCWSPINTQNTAVRGAAIPAYYYVRMGYPLQGMQIDRFGDILSGYFIEACAKHLGHLVRVGSPVAEHRRSPHDLFNDLYHELAGIVIVEDLLPWLRALPLTGSTYPEAYASLADHLASGLPQFQGFVWDQGGRAFLQDTAHCMSDWLDAVKVVTGG